jgi:hypothetical protein
MSDYTEEEKREIQRLKGQLVAAKPSNAFLKALRRFQQTGSFTMDVDMTPAVPAEQVVWVHRDDRNDTLTHGFSARLPKMTDVDPSSPEGRADIRAFLAETATTIAAMGGMTSDGDPAIVLTPDARSVIIKLTNLSPSETLQEEDRASFRRAAAALLNTIIQIGRRHLVLLGDPGWNTPPTRKRDFLPLYTLTGDARTFSEMPPTTPKRSMAAIVMGSVTFPWVVWVLSRAWDKGVAGLRTAFTDPMFIAHRQLLASLASTTTPGIVKPLEEAQKDLVDALIGAQEAYAKETDTLRAKTHPASATEIAEEAKKPVGKQHGFWSVAKTMLWAGAGLFVGKVFYDVVRGKGPELDPLEDDEKTEKTYTSPMTTDGDDTPSSPENTTVTVTVGRGASGRSALPTSQPGDTERQS